MKIDQTESIKTLLRYIEQSALQIYIDSEFDWHEVQIDCHEDFEQTRIPLTINIMNSDPVPDGVSAHEVNLDEHFMYIDPEDKSTICVYPIGADPKEDCWLFKIFPLYGRNLINGTSTYEGIEE